jgi:hypothetical protein
MRYILSEVRTFTYYFNELEFSERERLNKIKNGVFWDVTPCGSCKNIRFGGTQRLLHQGDKESVN